jgi:flagellar biogenesis protein FliO
MRAPLAAVAVAVILPAVAQAEPAAPTADKAPSFEVRDRGDAVEVIAHNIKAARTAIMPLRQRLQIPVVGLPLAKRVQPGDPTVKLIEFDSDAAIRVLSVKLSFERDDVRTLSRFAQAIQVGDDLHVLVPRKVPTDGVAPRLPGPSLPPELAAAIAKIDQADADRRTAPAAAAHKPDAKTDAKIDAKIDAKPDAKPAAKIDAKTEAKIDVKPDPIAQQAAAIQAAARAEATPTGPAAPPATDARRPADPRSLKQALVAESDDAWSKVTTYGALGLAAAGAGIWMMRRRKAHLATTATIDVIAQRSLGGKARILWLSAGPRELIVSVTGQQVRLLGQWRKSDAQGALPAAHTHADTVHVDPSLVEPSHAEPRFAEPRYAEPRYAEPRYAEPAETEPADPRDEPTPIPAYRPPFGQSAEGTLPPQHPRPRRATRETPSVSPAVSGILRLRARTGQLPINDAVASGDIEADELWAKEILAATGGRP